MAGPWAPFYQATRESPAPNFSRPLTPATIGSPCPNLPRGNLLAREDSAISPSAVQAKDGGEGLRRGRQWCIPPSTRGTAGSRIRFRSLPPREDRRREAHL